MWSCDQKGMSCEDHLICESHKFPAVVFVEVVFSVGCILRQHINRKGERGGREGGRGRKRRERERERGRGKTGSQSTMAISGLMLAACMSGPITMGRYCTKPGPMILHILAHALIKYETWKFTTETSKKYVTWGIHRCKKCTQKILHPINIFSATHCKLTGYLIIHQNILRNPVQILCIPEGRLVPSLLGLPVP